MLSNLLLMLAGVALLIFGFSRLIVSFRQIKQFIFRNKSKKNG
jgi:hypothetical protein